MPPNIKIPYEAWLWTDRSLSIRKKMTIF